MLRLRLSRLLLNWFSRPRISDDSARRGTNELKVLMTAYACTRIPAGELLLDAFFSVTDVRASDVALMPIAEGLIIATAAGSGCSVQFALVPWRDMTVLSFTHDRAHLRLRDRPHISLCVGGRELDRRIVEIARQASMAPRVGVN